MASPGGYTCPRCGADHRFDELVLLDVLSPARLVGIVTSWPPDAIVEVRRCSRCEAPVARTAVSHSARDVSGSR
jgi:hypothetical protein